MVKLVVKSETVPSELHGSAVSLTNVSFAFHDSAQGVVSVLQGFTTDFRYGEVAGVAGNNAAGKTTLLNIIRGTLTPQSGTVSVGGKVVSRDGRRFRLPEVSMVSQQPISGLGPTMTVYENFVMASRGRAIDFRPAYRASLRRGCCELLSTTNIGLETKLDEQVRFLSGGQQQALSVLLSLKDEGRVLLMDEPTASLSRDSTDTLFGLVLREVRVAGVAALLVSHRAQELLQYCDKILVLGGGRNQGQLVRGGQEWSEDGLSRLLAGSSSERSHEAK